MKKMKILGVSALCVASFTGGQLLAGNGASIVTYAGSGEPGTSSDPVITESYMKQELGKLQKQINDLKKQINGGSGGETVTPTPPPTNIVGVGTVTATNLNIRSGPSTSSSVVGSVTKGAKVNVLEKGNGWYKVQYGGTTGWCSSQYISMSSNPTPPVQSGKATVTASSLNVRSTPSTSGSVIGALKKGTVVTVLEKGNGWYKVQHGSVTGWCSSQYLKMN